MATYSEGLTLPGMIATGDLSGSQYKIVKLGTTANTVKVGSAGTDAIVGVLGNDPTDGQEALVQFTGVAKVLAEASVTKGSLVSCSATGRAKTTTTANHQVLGRALEASAAAGDLIRVQLGICNL